MTYIAKSHIRMLAEAIQIRKPSDFAPLLREAPLYKIAVGQVFAIVYPVKHETPNVVELAFAHVYVVGPNREEWLRNMLAMLSEFAQSLSIATCLRITFRGLDNYSTAMTLAKLGFKHSGELDLTADNYARFDVPTAWRKDY